MKMNKTIENIIKLGTFIKSKYYGGSSLRYFGNKDNCCSICGISPKERYNKECYDDSSMHIDLETELVSVKYWQESHHNGNAYGEKEFKLNKEDSKSELLYIEMLLKRIAIDLKKEQLESKAKREIEDRKLRDAELALDDELGL
jgi:hypothetical protein